MSELVPLTMPSKAWSTETLKAALDAVEHQHCKEEDEEALDANIKADVYIRFVGVQGSCMQ